ncbi:MAG: pseudouridine synthase [Pseudomonadota bacterium]
MPRPRGKGPDGPARGTYASRKKPASPSAKGPPAPREEGQQRIAKLLARAGIASRREIERMIEDGRIALDGVKLTTPATLLDTLNGVTVDGKAVAPAASTSLYLFYKPAGCLTAEHDPKGRPTIYDKLPPGLPRLIPVGRLDYATEGLMLLTNDGELKRKLELPRTGVIRTYRARAFGTIDQAALDNLADGITIDGFRYGSIIANLERGSGRNRWIEMSLTEGKNREIRNVLEHLGLQVSRLIRTAYGPFNIEGMQAGNVGEVPRELLFRFRQELK